MTPCMKQPTANTEFEMVVETPSGSKSTRVTNEPLSDMKYERQTVSERVPAGELLHGELHNDIGTVFQRVYGINVSHSYPEMVHT